MLRDRFDLVVDFCEPNLPELTYDRRLELEIQARARSQPPLLWVAANKGWNHFVYQRVDLKERAYADRLGLNRQRVENIYETTLRLIAELGRPPRLGQTPPETDSVLAGLPCPEAEAAWAELVRPNRRDRPVALVCPFGGAEPLKGYVERQADLLAEQLRALIEEGLYVVLQPNGMPWGSAGHARNGRQPPDAVRAGPGRGCA